MHSFLIVRISRSITGCSTGLPYGSTEKHPDCHRRGLLVKDAYFLPEQGQLLPDSIVLLLETDARVPAIGGPTAGVRKREVGQGDCVEHSRADPTRPLFRQRYPGARALDESWWRTTSVAGPSENRLELLRNDLLENGVVRPAGNIRDRPQQAGSPWIPYICLVYFRHPKTSRERGSSMGRTLEER